MLLLFLGLWWLLLAILHIWLKSWVEDRPFMRWWVEWRCMIGMAPLSRFDLRCAVPPPAASPSPSVSSLGAFRLDFLGVPSDPSASIVAFSAAFLAGLPFLWRPVSTLSCGCCSIVAVAAASCDDRDCL